MSTAIVRALAALTLFATLSAAKGEIVPAIEPKRDPFLLGREQGTPRNDVRRRARIERPPKLVGWIRTDIGVSALFRDGRVASVGETLSGWTFEGEEEGTLTFEKAGRRVELRLEEGR